MQEVDLALMQMKSETLKKIDQAILRLEEGTYGRARSATTEIAPAAPARPALRRRCAATARRRRRATSAPQREAKAFERLQQELVNVTLRAGARD